jgi:allantoate deiminase
VGRIDALPGAMNVIPGKVRFSIDVRSPTDDKRHAVANAMREALEMIAQRRNVGIVISTLWEAKTSPCHPDMQRQIAAAIAAEGGRVHHLPSGAGHDGMALVEIAPIGMLFVRCKGGISHNPAEAVMLDDIAAGARAFARFIAAFTTPRR